ncbi:mast/stem cell growth factor receptor kita-like [Porites lutea]|uniref:mast/stem cell growth factor receptor kita-like n=1 Tax=Porites lutea TaxID=51062 RepID=UPI003CC687E2
MISEKEKQFVHELSSPRLKNQSAWIGLVHRLPKDIYSWNDGSSFNPSLSVNWCGNTTSKLNGNGTKCVELLRYGWNLTECCKETEYYICEKPKGPLSCPFDHDEGHLNGLSCYYKHRTSKTRENAKEDCTASGSNLVKINGTNKNDTGFLIRLLDTINFKEVAELISKPRSMVIPLSVGAAFAALLLGAAIFIWCYRRRRRQKEVYGSYLLQRPINPLDEWEILREQIEYEEELGRGAFGVVYKAMLWERVGIEVFSTEISKRKLLSSKKPRLVAVKVLLDNPSAAQKEEFQFEIEQMKQLGSHPNVVSLVGCCTLQEEKFLVIEYVPFGDLLTWLRRRRNRIYTSQASNKAYNDKVSLKDEGNAKNQVQDKEEEKQDEEFKTIDEDQPTAPSAPMENQMTKGTNHLAEKNLVHRDLAARNVLVGCDNRVKVSDFGLMRQVYEDVNSSGKCKKLPIKWMAPESLYQGTFTIKSDVWSYGVLLWEMATLGGVPYPTLTNTELYRELNSGYRMEKPDMSSDEV